MINKDFMWFLCLEFEGDFLVVVEIDIVERLIELQRLEIDFVAENSLRKVNRASFRVLGGKKKEKSMVEQCLLVSQPDISLD